MGPATLLLRACTLTNRAIQPPQCTIFLIILLIFSFYPNLWFPGKKNSQCNLALKFIFSYIYYLLSLLILSISFNYSVFHTYHFLFLKLFFGYFLLLMQSLLFLSLIIMLTFKFIYCVFQYVYFGWCMCSSCYLLCGYGPQTCRNVFQSGSLCCPGRISSTSCDL